MGPSRSVLLALAIVTASTLMSQVAVTRLFSAVLAYHFSFLAISLAMLGVGAGALLVYVRPRWFREPTQQLLTEWCTGYATALIVLPMVFVHLDLSGNNELDLAFATNLAIACAVTALPPLASGVVVALAIDRYSEWIGRVYAWDLVGAGLGALVVVPLLGWVPAPLLLATLALGVAAAAGLFAPEGKRRPALLAAVIGAVVFGFGTTTSLLSLSPGVDGERFQVVSEHWTPLTRVMGITQRNNPDFAAVIYDRAYAPVPIVRDGRLPGWKKLRTGPQSIGYALTGPGHALVIGGGGGRDIYTALEGGQRPVDVIELNEGVRRVVDEDLASLSATPYSRDGVHSEIGDGRSLLARRDQLYDQIHLGFTDTLSANAAQGFALSENNLYTLEAFELYLDHLKPYGVLNVSRLVKLVGDEAIRATVLMWAALERRGIADPSKHIVVIMGRDLLGPSYGTTLGRLQPWTKEELARIRELAAERGTGVAFAPGGPYQGAWQELARAASWQEFVDDYPLLITPPTDDRPFFFNMARLWSGSDEGYHYTASPFALLMLTSLILSVLSALAFALPLALMRDTELPSLGSLSYFVAIGLGFMLVEVVLIQRFVLFLGFPTYALSVVLASLLVFSGVGSLLTSRTRDPRGGVSLALSLAVAWIALSAAALEPLLRLGVGWPFALRLAVTFAVIAPLGVALGAAMPFGLQRFRALHPTSVAYAWGVNGVASVLASVLGVAIAVNFGFVAASLAGLACYAFALAHVRWGEWPGVKA